MATFHFTATTGRLSPEVFDFFADMTNAQSWDPSISSAVRLDEGPVREGSSFRVTLGFLGRDLVLDYHVVVFESPSRVVLRAETGLFVSEDTVKVTDLGDGRTRVEYEAILRGKGVTAVLDPLFKLAINHFGKQAGVVLRDTFLR